MRFGDIIVENLKNNIKQELDNGYIQCEICGKRVEETNNKKKYCNECARKKKLENDRKLQRERYYNSRK